MDHLSSIESNNVQINNKESENITNSLVIIENENINMPILNNIVIQATGIDLNFIIGTIIGDGSFYVSFLANKKYKFGFNITTDSKDFLTLLKIKNRLNCGRLYLKSHT
jgi:hypothetical protein